MREGDWRGGGSGGNCLLGTGGCGICRFLPSWSLELLKTFREAVAISRADLVPKKTDFSEIRLSALVSGSLCMRDTGEAGTGRVAPL